MNAELFYQQLTDQIKQIVKDNIVVIGGDANTQIGKDYSIMSYYKDTNRNVWHLLICVSTKFRQIMDLFQP